MTEDDSEKRMTAPLLRRYVEDKALNGYYLTEKEDVELFEQIESIIRELPPSEKDLDYRRLWISIPRGPIEDYGNFDDGCWESYEEFEDSWRYHHPDDKDWYVFHYEKTSRGERFIAVDGLVLFHDDADRPFRKQSHYHTELLRWLVGIVREQVNSVKAGTYRDTVLNELPIGYREGVVKRSDIWESRYWTRKADMDGTTSKDIEGFSKIVEAGVNEIPKHRLDSMTLNDYLGLCSMCFRIRGEDISGMTLKEQFKRFADGRDDGLLEIYPDDPDAFTEFCRTSNSGPVLDYDFDSVPDGGHYLMDPTLSTAHETIEQVKRANKCIECGFCEVNCMSCGLTLSSRMRIAVQREIRYLTKTGTDPQRLATLKKQYKYYGDQTCATDGLCSTSCPMKINTGELTHLIRQMDMNESPTGYKLGEFAANHMAGIKSGLRVVLDVAHAAHITLGPTLMTSICRGMNKMGMPLWTTAMPKKHRQPKKSDLTQFIIEKSIPHKEEQHSELKVVYFPSCINQTMGQSKHGGKIHDLVDEVIQLMAKAGYEVIFPEGMERMCCGQIWESKGMLDIADRKSAELEAALWKASEEGKYPVLCAQSPCLHRMKKVMHRMDLYEPAEFIMKFLVPRLDFHPIDRHIALHLTCSTRQMGVDKDMIELAKLCSKNVFLPEGVGCCGFAGDRGFTFPELNSYGLRKLRPQIEANGIEVGYSNSRTCEIGLETNSGIPYMSIVYLVNECTTPKKQ